MTEPPWESLVQRDPYLAGNTAARGHEWWDDRSAESEADSVGLVGERRADFLRGWNDEIAERDKERKNQLFEEYEQMGKGYEKGDPAR